MTGCPFQSESGQAEVDSTATSQVQDDALLDFSQRMSYGD